MIATPAPDPTMLYLPTLGKEIPRPWFLPTPETLAEQRRIMESVYFLVNIAGGGTIGEALICDPKKGGCGQKHKYITLRCVEQPFSGLTGGLYAYFRAVKDHGLVDALSPSERLRLDAIQSRLSRLSPFAGLPDLATSHPDLAKRLTGDLGPRDAMGAGVALGILEPIPPTLARKYARRINLKGIRPRFTLPGPAGQGG